MTFKLHVGRKNTWASSFSVYKYFQKIPVYLLQLPRLSHFPAVMIHDGSICGFISLLLLSNLKIENIWNVMKVFALFMSTWRQQNPKWRLSCHPKSLDNQTQTLQTQDISVIHKANSSSLSFLWALASLDGANLFSPPKRQICVIPPQADRRLLQNTSNGSCGKLRVHCHLYLLKGKRNVNHGLCEEPQNSSLPSYYNLNMNRRIWMLKSEKKNRVDYSYWLS